MDSKLKVLFCGEVLPSYKPEQVKANLAQLFKISINKLDSWFTGETVVVKDGVDYPTAIKYKNAFEQAGAVCLLKEVVRKGKAPAKPSVDDTSHEGGTLEQREIRVLRKLVEKQQQDILTLQNELQVQRQEMDELREIVENLQLEMGANALTLYEEDLPPAKDERVEQAYVALKRIEASINSGVNLITYSNLVNEALLTVELAQDAQEQNIQFLIEALSFYQKAKEIWEMDTQSGFLNAVQSTLVINQIENSSEFKQYIRDRGFDPDAKGFSRVLSKMALGDNPVKKFLWYQASNMLQSFKEME